MKIKDLITMLQALDGERELTLNFSLSSQGVSQPVEPSREQEKKTRPNKFKELAKQITTLNDRRESAYTEYYKIFNKSREPNGNKDYWLLKISQQEQVVEQLEKEISDFWTRCEREGIIKKVENAIMAVFYPEQEDYYLSK